MKRKAFLNYLLPTLYGLNSSPTFFQVGLQTGVVAVIAELGPAFPEREWGGLSARGASPTSMYTASMDYDGDVDPFSPPCNPRVRFDEIDIASGVSTPLPDLVNTALGLPAGFSLLPTGVAIAPPPSAWLAM
jgi:hypothetical protein